MPWLSNMPRVHLICRKIPESLKIKVEHLFGSLLSLRFHSQLHGHIVRRSFFGKSNEVKQKQKPWRDAASLLIVAPMNESEPYSLGYLMIERSKGSSVMPGGLVFPGGAVSPVDYSPRWIDLFKSSSSPIDLTTLRFLSENAHIPEIYNDNKVEIDKPVPFSKEIILRLTAIRETFEEVGILLCKPMDGTSVYISDRFPYDYEELRDRKQVFALQKKMHKNPEEFINLCERLKCLPDLTALSDWGNWLTPTIFKPKSRFDTMFYMTILPKMPRVAYDQHEVASVQWGDPSSLLKDHVDGKLRLMPPQLYEMNRLKNLHSISELEERLRLRVQLGIERYFPVVQKTKDGTVFLLPGDDLYPKNPDFYNTDKPQKVDATLNESKSSSSKFHRGEIKEDIYTVYVNVQRYGHSY